MPEYQCTIIKTHGLNLFKLTLHRMGEIYLSYISYFFAGKILYPI